MGRTPSIALQGLLVLLLGLSARTTSAREAQAVPERPWITAWMASIGRTLAAVDVVYDSIDRPDLSDTLEERLDFREFRGIDRSRPLGMMWTWNDAGDPAATVFLPIQEMEELMATATFGVVGFHKVHDDQWEIERPGVPYHVLMRSGNALFGEDTAALHALREAPERVTRDLRDQYDLAVLIDQRQVPEAARQAWIESWRSQLEPWLQPQDGEPRESAFLRRALGTGLLDACERIVKDVETITIGARIDRRTYQIQLEIRVQSASGSSMAAELNRLVVQRSEFSALVNRNASAGLAVNWPVMLLGKEFAALNKELAVGGRLDLGVQVVGGDWNDMSLIAGMRGPEAAALSAALPQLLARMEGPEVEPGFDRKSEEYRQVSLKRISPGAVPEVLRSLSPEAVEMWIGQEKSTVWFAAGPSGVTHERLKAAIDIVAETPPSERSNAVMQARLAVGQWPEVLPLVDRQDTQSELGESRDGFRLSLEPIQNGFKVRVTADQGLLRVIGRRWAREVDFNSSIR